MDLKTGPKDLVDEILNIICEVAVSELDPREKKQYETVKKSLKKNEIVIINLSSGKVEAISSNKYNKDSHIKITEERIVSEEEKEDDHEEEVEEACDDEMKEEEEEELDEASLSPGDTVVYLNRKTGKHAMARIVSQERAQTYKIKLRRTGKTTMARASELKHGDKLPESVFVNATEELLTKELEEAKPKYDPSIADSADSPEEDDVEQEAERQAHAGDPQMGEESEEELDEIRRSNDRQKKEFEKRLSDIEAHMKRIMKKGTSVKPDVKLKITKLKSDSKDLVMGSSWSRRLDSAMKRADALSENFAASPEPNSAVGHRRKIEVPKHIDVVDEMIHVGGVKSDGFRLMMSFPGGKAVFFPEAQDPHATSLEELTKLVDILPLEYREYALEAIAHAAQRPHMKPVHSGNVPSDD